MPGQMACVRRVSGSNTSWIGSAGQWPCVPARCRRPGRRRKRIVTESLVSPRTLMSWLANLFRRVPGENAAVHVGLRGLRQGVVGVPRRKRVGTQVVRKLELKIGLLDEPRGRGRDRAAWRVWRGCPRPSAGLLLRQAFEIGACDGVQLERKRVRLQLGQRGGRVRRWRCRALGRNCVRRDWWR